MASLYQNKNFVLLFSGRLISNMGDSLYYIAAMWLAYDLGGSSFYSGLAGFLTLLPEFFSFLAGPIVDRVVLKKVLIVPNLVQGILVLLVPLLYLLHLLTVTGVLVIMPLIAMFDLFPFPAENALIPKLISEKYLVKANSAMSFAYQGTDLVFSSLGGILIAVIGAVSLYFIDSVTFFIAALLFALLRLGKSASLQKPEGKSPSYWADLSEGLQFVLHPLILKMLFPFLISNFVLSGVLAIFPAFSKQIGGPAVYGILMSSYTAGFLAGTLLSGFVSQKFSMGKAVIYGYGCSGIMWILMDLAAPHSVPLACIFLAMANIPVGATNILFSSFFQIVPPSNMIGRVAAVTESLIAAAMPLGSLAGGVLASWTGTHAIIISQGVVIILIAVYWLLTKKLRQLPDIDHLSTQLLGMDS
ncbi:MFS transporter [Sporolactobacillus shoreae]|uniref:MFS transporter n=1 Tax=Sporolactobacillus shoreae TaxID=1465501 RepID=A0A4Z0GMA4_9BACL|nr:MFS transporter [Sporolactobacillus shoreae]TGA97642.1 MFS transporter [Sporolactobacillus shoreae]